jgi:predicted PurR-regulated permease PerM
LAPDARWIETWLPRDHKAMITWLATEINDDLGVHPRARARLHDSAAIYALGPSWVGLRYGLLIGLMTGVLSFILFVEGVGLLTATVLALLEYWPDTVPLLKVIGVFAAGR